MLQITNYFILSINSLLALRAAGDFRHQNWQTPSTLLHPLMAWQILEPLQNISASWQTDLSAILAIFNVKTCLSYSTFSHRYNRFNSSFNYLISLKHSYICKQWKSLRCNLNKMFYYECYENVLTDGVLHYKSFVKLYPRIARSENMKNISSSNEIF